MPDGVADDVNGGHIRVATKYPTTTSRYYLHALFRPNALKLNGAMELAPRSRIIGPDC
jgi:ATP phosphoribosyltransferase